MDRCANSEAEASYSDGVMNAELNFEEFEESLDEAKALVAKAKEEFESTANMYNIDITEYSFQDMLDSI